MQIESLLSDIVNSKLQHKYHNCSNYNLMIKQQHPIILINSE